MRKFNNRKVRCNITGIQEKISFCRGQQKHNIKQIAKKGINSKVHDHTNIINTNNNNNKNIGRPTSSGDQ